MEVLNNEVLNMLIQERKGPCLSLYIPTHRQWNELNQDMLRFKNQLKDAEKILSESGMTDREIKKFMQPAYKLAEDREFWNHQQDGLVVFISDKEFYHYRAPFNFQQKTYLNKRFYTKHLLPVYNGDRDFFILSLDLHNIRMFRGYHYSIKEIDLTGLYVNIEDALGLDNDWEKKMQYRAEISAGNTQRANFHGHGSRNDATMRKRDIHRFYEMVNDGIMEILKHEKAPLVLAGVDLSASIYKEVNKYQFLYDDFLQLDADFTEPVELFDRANKLLDPYFNETVQKDLEKYGNLVGTGKASDNIREIIRAAYENRVSILFMNPDDEIWGNFDMENYTTEVSDNGRKNGYEDLVDLAGTQTLLRNGIIYTLPAENMPNGRAVAAIYRF
jgi:hypothetical protein